MAVLASHCNFGFRTFRRSALFVIFTRRRLFTITRRGHAINAGFLVSGLFVSAIIGSRAIRRRFDRKDAFVTNEDDRRFNHVLRVRVSRANGRVAANARDRFDQGGQVFSHPMEETLKGRAAVKDQKVLPLHRAVCLIIRRRSVRIRITTSDVSGVIATSDRAITIADGRPSTRIQADHLRTNDSDDAAAVGHVGAMYIRMVEWAKEASSAESGDRVVEDRSCFNRYFIRTIRRNVISAAQAPTCVLVTLVVFQLGFCFFDYRLLDLRCFHRFLGWSHCSGELSLCTIRAMQVRSHRFAARMINGLPIILFNGSRLLMFTRRFDHILERQASRLRIDRDGLLSLLLRDFRYFMRISMYSTPSSSRRIYVKISSRFRFKSVVNGLISLNLTNNGRLLIISKIYQSDAYFVIFFGATRAVNGTLNSQGDPVTGRTFLITTVHFPCFFAHVMIKSVVQFSFQVFDRIQRLPYKEAINSRNVHRRSSEDRVFRNRLSYPMDNVRAIYQDQDDGRSDQAFAIASMGHLRRINLFTLNQRAHEEAAALRVGGGRQRFNSRNRASHFTLRHRAKAKYKDHDRTANGTNSSKDASANGFVFHLGDSSAGLLVL